MAAKVTDKMYAKMFFRPHKDMAGRVVEGEWQCLFEDCQKKYQEGRLKPTVSKHGYSNCISHLKYALRYLIRVLPTV